MNEYVTMEKPFWKSKKWITSVIAALIPIANAIFGLNLDTTEVITVVLPLVVYVMGQAKIDAEH